ncbi:MAG: cytochrome b [Gammaproteobacteria bacterium]|nr:cytochrome b [Gammaproteobacteria bacterium]
MQFKNTTSHFGLIAISLHWLVALCVFALFGLGLWMTELDYYHQWYKQGPWLHKSIGILLFFVVIFRLFWRGLTPPPKALSSHKPWERKIAHIVHLLLYFLLIAIMFSGYLISTADGRAIEVFDWFSIPASITSINNQEDIAGWVHFILAILLIGLAALHALAAIKHHFIDRDRTLQRIFGK